MKKSMNTEVVVVDDYINDLSLKINETGKDINLIIAEYTRILSNIRETGITAGQTADAVEEFSEAAKCLNEKYLDACNCMFLILGAYIEDIDKADKYLY